MLSEYEKIRLENIKKNKELLASLGFDKPTLEPKEPKRAKKPPPPRKRKISESPSNDSEDSEPQTKSTTSKTPRVLLLETAPESAVRRSSRNAGKAIDYKKEIVKESPVPVAYSSGVKSTENTGPMGREEGKRKHNPKIFGHIPGIEIGTWWETRQGCSTDSVHAPWVGGIFGGSQGAYSVAVSGGYDDDVDLGYVFTYSGCGGRDLKGTKAAPKNLRTAPQSSDQTFENRFNRMLQKSCETRKPVRVIRGFKSQSPYAPTEGYRYDGLYTVEKAWAEKGNNPKGYIVCKFAFKRLSGQPPLPVRNTAANDSEIHHEDEEITEQNAEEIEKEESEEI